MADFRTPPPQRFEKVANFRDLGGHTTRDGKRLGPGRLLENGQRASLSVSIGDEVIYGKYSGSDIEVDGHDVKILRETDILAKVMK